MTGLHLHRGAKPVAATEGRQGRDVVGTARRTARYALIRIRAAVALDAVADTAARFEGSAAGRARAVGRSIGGNGNAQTFAARDVAGFTLAGAGLIAAESVDADAGKAAIARGTGFAGADSRLADAGQTELVQRTLVVDSAVAVANRGGASICLLYTSPSPRDS